MRWRARFVPLAPAVQIRSAPARTRRAARASLIVTLQTPEQLFDRFHGLVDALQHDRDLCRIRGLALHRNGEWIFTGDVTDWSAVGGNPGPISVYTRNTSSGTYSEFKELAMKKRDYAPSGQKMAGNEQIASEVGKNANGVGYVGLAYTKAGGIKVVAIDGGVPSVKSVQSKSYPYARPTFYYTNGDPSGAAKAFVDFTLSPAGQKIVLQVGFVPIR